MLSRCYALSFALFLTLSIHASMHVANAEYDDYDDDCHSDASHDADTDADADADRVIFELRTALLRERMMRIQAESRLQMPRPISSANAPKTCGMCGFLSALLAIFVALSFGALSGVAGCFLRMGHKLLRIVLLISLAYFLVFAHFLFPLGLLFCSFFLFPLVLCGLCGVVSSHFSSRCCKEERATRLIPEGESLPAAGISPGARGPGVAQLQQALIKLKHMDRSCIRWCAGIYGPYTTAAVCRLQESLGETPTGVLTKQVRECLQAQLNQGSNPAASSGDSNQQRKSTHYGVTCDASGMSPIVGVRYHKRRSNYDLCEAEFDKLTQDEQKQYDRIEHPRRAPFLFGVSSFCCDTDGPQKKAFLLEMGFSEQQISNAFMEASGSWAQAADCLIENQSMLDAETNQVSETEEVIHEPKPACPCEWQGPLRDLQDMGFDEDRSFEALANANGDLKAAVKELVQAERKCEHN